MNNVASVVVQFTIGITLLLSSIPKWRDLAGFASGIADYEILPERFSYLLAVIICILESWVAIAHLSGWFLALAAPVGLMMFASFAVAVTINLKRGRQIPCACFGSEDDHVISGRTLARLFLLLAGEGFLLVARGFHTGGSPLTWQAMSWTNIGLAILWAALLLVGVAWLLRLTDLQEALRSSPR